MTDLCLVKDVAAQLGQDPDPTDERLLAFITQASAKVRQYTGQVFGVVADETLYLSGSGTDRLQLPQCPILATTSVDLLDYYTYQPVIPPVGFTYQAHAASGLLYRLDYIWPIGRGNIKVVYSHGYVLPGEDYSGDLTPEPLPDIVVTTTASIAAALYSADPSGTVTAENIGGYSAGFGAGGGADADELLKDLWNFRVVDAA